jgi:hypothetical protein
MPSRLLRSNPCRKHCLNCAHCTAEGGCTAHVRAATFGTGVEELSRYGGLPAGRYSRHTEREDNTQEPRPL